MAHPLLTLRQLNRATLARQMLLERSAVSAADAIERLVGLHAQIAHPPYVSLWSRVRGFDRDSLAGLINSREVLKAPLMRITLHLMTRSDYLKFYSTLRPALTMGWAAITKSRKPGFSREKILDAAKSFLTDAPRSFAAISAMLAELEPDHDIGSMRYLVRTHLPLVQVPVDSRWSFPGNPEFALSEPWIGKRIPEGTDLRGFIRRYLAAFGPASASDMQTWCGLPGLKTEFEKMKPELLVYQDEKKRELYDLPGQTPPSGDEPAPVRFLPEFDNLLLSHTKRTRVIADEHRPRVYLPALRVAATFLIDGFVGGTWSVERKKGEASMTLQPFNKLGKKDREALLEEGESLLRFLEPEAKVIRVQ